ISVSQVRLRPRRDAVPGGAAAARGAGRGRGAARGRPPALLPLQQADRQPRRVRGQAHAPGHRGGRRRRRQLLVGPRPLARPRGARGAVLRDRRAPAGGRAGGGRARAGGGPAGGLGGRRLRPDLRLPEARRRAPGGDPLRRAAGRDEPRPYLPGGGRGDPGCRGHDRGGGGGDGPPGRADRGEAVGDHRRGRARAARPRPRGVRDRGGPPGDGHRAGEGDRAGDHPRPHRHHAARRPGDRALGARPRPRLPHRSRRRRAASVMSRLAGLDAAPVDAIVVGGGMAGAGVARELALRGLSCVLLEQGDFASGTTSRSSKLIHGGLRYLELLDFGLVRESLRERETLARLAPHLDRPLPFLVPVYRGGTRSLVKVRIGIRLYDWLTPGKRTPRYRTLRPAEALALEPTLRPEDLLGAGYYFDDLLLSPERLCLENVLAARRAGALAVNYARVEDLRPARGGGWEVHARDLVDGTVTPLVGRVLVNAAGPWVDRI